MFGVFQICLIQGIDSGFHCVVKIHLHSLFRITFQVLYGVSGFRKHHHKMLNVLLTEKNYDHFIQESLLIISVIVFLVCSRKLVGKNQFVLNCMSNLSC